MQKRKGRKSHEDKRFFICTKCNVGIVEIGQRCGFCNRLMTEARAKEQSGIDENKNI